MKAKEYSARLLGKQKTEGEMKLSKAEEPNYKNEEDLNSKCNTK